MIRALASRIALCLALAAPLAAQQPSEGTSRLRQQEELERIRKERQILQERMDQLQSSVHDLSEDLANLDRQADATARLVRQLDAALLSLSTEVTTANRELVRAEDELVAKRAALQHRLGEIYKRGPLYSVEVMLSAQSFGALVARYKYLHVLAQRDRALVHRVEELRNQTRGQRQTLVRLQRDLEANRADRAAEGDRLRTLEAQRQASLRRAQRSADQVAQRLEAIRRDEQRVSGLIASFETERLRTPARSSARAPSGSSLRTGDYGRLDWPVDGTILYRFGRVVNPNNTTTRWNGIGIGASEGTVVKSIAGGEVVAAEAFGTYGLTVIVQHGGGDYSVYGSLARIDVRKGQRIAKGQTLGTVGSSDPDMPPHLHLEIRRGRGEAVDPLGWLRGER